MLYRFALVIALILAGLAVGHAVKAAEIGPGPDRHVLAMGLALAHTYCADCHAIGETGTSRHAAAPAFRDLNADYDAELLAETLVEGLAMAHPDMPEFEFDPPQAQALIIYLKTVQAAAAARE